VISENIDNFDLNSHKIWFVFGVNESEVRLEFWYFNGGLMFQVKVFWVVTPFSVVVEYKHFTLKKEAACISETFVSTTTLQGVIIHKTSTR
jgi:hypothetical protein